MKTKKLGYSNRCLYDLEGIRDTLEKMALKGWKCKKFGYIFTHYEKIEPQKLNYEVIFLPSLTMFDGVPTESQETLIEMCTESGWEYICQWGNAVIFCSEKENPTPIETDETLKLESIHKSIKKEVLPSQFAMMFLFPIIGWFQIGNIYTQPEQFYGGFGIFTLLMAIIVTVLTVLITGHYFHWYKQSKKSVEQGGFCAKPLNIYWIMNLLSASVIAILVFAGISGLDRFVICGILIQFGVVGISFGVIAFLRKQTFSNKLKKTMYWVFSLTLPMCVMVFGITFILSNIDLDSLNQEVEFPLEISDIRPEENLEYKQSHIGGGTFLMDWGSFSLSPDYDGLVLNYSLYQSKSDYIAEKMLNGKLFLEEYQLDNGLRWEKIHENDELTVWKCFRNNTPLEEYLIQSGRNLIHIDYDDGFTETEKVKAVEILLAEIS